ncbi:universal stress protein [Halobacteria archaeon AArc-m2/3/4]|uniref:Universal stress protein n=1 Tax=Natronoglomus mannanivorans TaxID=2979990 RepID=A0AAP2YXT6_9EURY|nr:universal stress protein [Halobacteria archaeon AArc-xg1-1]MCU4973265.1 universal stress protein [Halobacteria archaeon AArc-m2/3/4]
MTLTFDGTVVVPAADPNDGERTARALAPRLAPGGRAVVVYVVEKAGGAPDKTSVEQSEEYAADVFEAARGPLEVSDGTVETEILYGTDIVETIFDAAGELNADGVVFVPRESNRLAELLTGDVALKLVKEASVPVVSLPEVEIEDAD